MMSAVISWFVLIPIIQPKLVSIKADVAEATKRTRATNWTFGTDAVPKKSSQQLDYTDPLAAKEYQRVAKPFSAPFRADGSARDWQSTIQVSRLRPFFAFVELNRGFSFRGEQATYQAPVGASRARSVNMGPELRATHWSLGSDEFRPRTTMRSDYTAPERSSVRFLFQIFFVFLVR
jgi:hypothetical protein